MAPDAGAIALICHTGFYQVHESGFVKQDLESFCQQAYAPEAIATDLEKEDRFYLVLVCDEKPVGCLRMAPPTLDLAKPDSSGFELARFYLEQGHQSGGWGGKMLAMAENETRRRGYRNIWLHVFIPNSRAQAFYLRHGYQKMGQEKLIYRQSQPTGFVLKKSLVAGDPA